MKKKMIYSLTGFLAIILFALLIAYPSYKKQMKEASERIKSESRLLETRFGLMEYAMRGKGKPVLLIHGAGGGFDQGLWLGQICLNDDYRLIAPSKFGYLGSEMPKEYSAKLQAQQYRILLDSLEIEKVQIIGVSAGGPSAMQFANDYKKFTGEQKELASELLDVMHPMSLRYKGTVTDGLIIQNFSIPDSIGVPTLIIHSKNDGLVSFSHAEFSHQKIKDSKLVLYENGGHGAISELEDARKQISTFLND